VVRTAANVAVDVAGDVARASVVAIEEGVGVMEVQDLRSPAEWER